MLVLKTRPPTIPPGLVRRPRLFDALTAAAQRPFTLVGAGPGGGKTLAVASWALSTSLSAKGYIGWLSLDDADNDPRVFWSDLLFALIASGGVPDDSPLRDLIPATGFGSAEALDVANHLAEWRRRSFWCWMTSTR